MVSETKPPPMSVHYQVRGGLDAFSRQWQKRVPESKLRILVQGDLLTIKEMETTYHARAALAFQTAVLSALLNQCIPGTTLVDVPLKMDGTGRKYLS
jgi:hypothetical protein